MAEESGAARDRDEGEGTGEGTDGTGEGTDEGGPPSGSDADAGTGSGSGSGSGTAKSGADSYRPRPSEAPPADDHPSSEFSVPDGIAPPEGAEEEHTTSEFAVPTGVAEPAVAEQEGSAFATPSTYRARRSPTAFTPADGIPKVTLTKDAPWQDRMRTMLRMPVGERPVPEVVQRHDESGPAVPRVLDLTLRIGELLLAGGEGAEDVEAAMFAISRSYGLDRCEPTVTFTLLSITYQPSLVDDPVTANRTVRRRGTDYTRLSAVFKLVHDISTPDTEVSLEEAYRRLAEIRRNRHPFPGWALTLAGGLLAGAASVLVGGGYLVFVAAAISAMLGDRLAWLCAGRGLPEFYQFVVAAMPPAAMGVALSLSSLDVRASAVITGGLFALIPGRALVAGVQDGLTGFYITAAARLLEVGYLVVGIVTGVLSVLYLGIALGAELTPETALHTVERPAVQLLAAMALVFCFAILLQQDRDTVLLVTLNGGVAWSVYGALALTADVPPVAATAVAAGLVGLFGQMLSRAQHASALPYITAAIGPLLPGSATYFALLAMARGELNTGLASLSKAVALALAIAIGVNLGSELSRLFLRVPAVAAGLPGPSLRRRAAKRTRGF
ncbi:threonine/serine exporter family protein [Streptomyces tsukubensis]|uniref:threonine/serine ThrE exporter family protein n=1 Tax=Streptomyces tsukubensis TaxID=83656 RepID=UPI003693BD02